LATDEQTQARIDRFKAMVAQFPQSEVPRFSLGQAYMEAGQLEEAAKTFTEVTDIKSDFMMAWVLRTRALIGLERFEDALPICQHALQLAIDQDHQDPKIDCELMLEEIQEEI
jgi:tetratricopeptide (TPR) repeat protein